jgi:serine/threonine protein kinase
MDYLRKKFGFCHRDLHPNNIYISFDDKIDAFFNTSSVIISDQNFIENFLKVLGITGVITIQNFCEKMEELIFVRIFDFDLSKMDLSKMNIHSYSKLNENVKRMINRPINPCSRVFNVMNDFNFLNFDVKAMGRNVKAMGRNFRGQLINATLDFRKWVLGISRYYTLPPAMENDADLYAWGQLYTAFLEITKVEGYITDMNEITNFEGCKTLMTKQIEKHIESLNADINYKKQLSATIGNLAGESLQEQPPSLSTDARPIVKPTIPSSSQSTRKEIQSSSISRYTRSGTRY